MKTEEQQAFYEALEFSNKVSKKQTNDALVMALVGKIAKAINLDEEPSKIKQLIELKNSLEE